MLVDIFAVPDAFTHLLGFGGGWLGGAGAGAAVGAVVAGFVAEPPPVDLFCGALLGVVDHLTGGALFGALFRDWRTGALTGSLVCGLTFLAVENPPDGEDRVGRAALVGLFFGGAAGGLVGWTGYLLPVAVTAGTLGGLYAGAAGREGGETGETSAGGDGGADP